MHQGGGEKKTRNRKIAEQKKKKRAEGRKERKAKKDKDFLMALQWIVQKSALRSETHKG